MNKLGISALLAFELLVGAALFGCVDTKNDAGSDAGESSGGGGEEPGPGSEAGADGTSQPMPEAAPLMTCTGDAAVSAAAGDAASSGPYAWKNVAMLGGGFVSGISFSPAAPDIVYARTDVGGAYRWEPSCPGRWVPLLDGAGRNQSNWQGVESIVPDPVDPDRVYIAAGEYLTAGNGVILRSDDRGATFHTFNIGAPMGGNANGRSMGERLAVDPNQTNVVYFASRGAGLWKSADAAATWSQVTTFPSAVTGDVNNGGYGSSFVLFDKSTGAAGAATQTIYVGVATASGPGLYRSTDSGATWGPVAGQPTGPAGADGGATAFFPHHGAFDGKGALYLAYGNNPGPNGITAGGVWKLDTASGAWNDVTPPTKCDGASQKCGYGGISVDAAHPGTIVVSTIDWWQPDEIYRSTDGGESWRPIGRVAASLRDTMGAQWLYFGGATVSATGWAGDIEIDPFHSDRALYITGQGIWWTDNLTVADGTEQPTWHFRDQGLEETVVLDLAVPPNEAAQGGAALLSAVGDIGGFRHDDLDSPSPEGMYANPVFGNTASIDFAEDAPLVVARVGSTSGTPTATNTVRRGAYSEDGGKTWKPFPNEPTVTASDGGILFSGGSGSIAVSADGSAFVWSPQGGRRSGTVVPAYTRDKGATWTPCAGLPANARVASDRVNANKFYAFATAVVDGGASSGAMFVSTDGGATFALAATGLPAGQGRPRPVFGTDGDLWLVYGAGTPGLYHSTDSGATFTHSPAVQAAYAVGFGKAAPSQNYPAVYLAGTIDSVAAIYRSDDAGGTWQRIDDDRHQFGWVQQIAGDPRSYGRVFVGTGGRGILYGAPNP